MEGQIAFWGDLSKTTATIVQHSGLRFRYRCSLPELGRHRTTANIGRSASDYGRVLLDGLKRGLPLHPLDPSDQRSLSSSLIKLLKSRPKSCLGETVSNIQTRKHHSPSTGGRFSSCGSYSSRNRLSRFDKSSTSLRYFSNDSCAHRARSDPSRYPPGGGKNQTSPQSLLSSYFPRSRSSSSSRKDPRHYRRSHRSRDPRS